MRGMRLSGRRIDARAPPSVRDDGKDPSVPGCNFRLGTARRDCGGCPYVPGCAVRTAGWGWGSVVVPRKRRTDRAVRSRTSAACRRLDGARPARTWFRDLAAVESLLRTGWPGHRALLGRRAHRLWLGWSTRFGVAEPAAVRMGGDRASGSDNRDRGSNTRSGTPRRVRVRRRRVVVCRGAGCRFRWSGGRAIAWKLNEAAGG
jgi:hypothetical protein